MGWKEWQWSRDGKLTSQGRAATELPRTTTSGGRELGAERVFCSSLMCRCLTCDQELKVKASNAFAKNGLLPKLDGMHSPHSTIPGGPGLNIAEMRKLASAPNTRWGGGGGRQEGEKHLLLPLLVRDWLSAAVRCCTDPTRPERRFARPLAPSTSRRQLAPLVPRVWRP